MSIFIKQNSKESGDLKPVSSSDNVDNIDTYLKLDRALDVWEANFEECERNYHQIVNSLGHRDAQIIFDSEKLIDMEQKLDVINNRQNDIEDKLSFMGERNQKLSSSLNTIEKVIENISSNQIFSKIDSQKKDVYRKKCMEMIESLDSEIKYVLNNISELINYANKEKNCDEVSRVEYCLNQNMKNLHWLETNTEILINKLNVVEDEFNQKMQQKHMLKRLR
ncbi:hypothetical protein A3Q56_02612 [Intoshia linei]|uniref:Nucleoporin NSP1-like C-terminal domain-containing protein n=1 Tax=Intoshia linei TaxID=1819745 RepID=A0A177B5U6_9BILA|nr:hypothetical protein A3Q56_02612 [Intoshia linei]